MSKPFYTTSEIAKIFGVYMTTVADWIDSGQLKAFRTGGGHRRVRLEDLELFLKEMRMPVPLEVRSDVPSILIIDDDPDIALMLKERLTGENLRVETAANGFEGMYKIGRRRPDVVVVDMMMPGMDGLEVCEEMNSAEELRDVYVIAMTGYEGGNLREQAMSKGADAFLKKPLDMEELLTVIQNFVGSNGRKVA